MPKQKVEVPKRILKVVERCRSCGYVMRTMPAISAGESVARWQYADGRDAPDLSVCEAIGLNLLVPQNDGLFGADTSQTWVPA